MTGKAPQAHVVLAGMGAAASSGLLGRCANGLGKHQILASIVKGGHVLAVEGLAQPAGGVCCCFFLIICFICIFLLIISYISLLGMRSQFHLYTADITTAKT